MMSIERLGLRQIEAVLSGRRDADRVLADFEPLLDGRGKLRFVFHDKYPHRSNVKLSNLTLASAKIQKGFMGGERELARRKRFDLTGAGAKLPDGL
jgi:hypothetical protein